MHFFFSYNIFYSIRKLYPHFFNFFDIISLFASELEELKLACEIIVQT